ncbi:hypothetical protein HO173_012620 [Letharia columbiana]|uniref:Uncharacterized protein n=1 Tax=Letharia columbiana TaxID=112416 RepID=A0A8H6CLS0_9LECA|nr:uncharacterized protein HO173_012620 [Letharia columbiana]KAF6225990.1 hypothetical protein HO173_012620 [Letharia columbiana]
MWLWGFALSVSAALSLISNSLVLANQRVNETGTFNVTTPASLKTLPDQVDYRVLGTPITIRFYGYGLDLDVKKGSALILLVTQGEQLVWDQPVEDDLLLADYEGMEFRFYPQVWITWRMLYETTLAMEYFFSHILRREFSFYLRLEGQEDFFGHGLMRMNDRRA